MNVELCKLHKLHALILFVAWVRCMLQIKQERHCVYNCASENVIQIYKSNSCIVTIGPGKLFGHLLDKVYIDCEFVTDVTDVSIVEIVK